MDSAREDTGRRLAQVRALHALSQRQLAKRSGVSNATISQIENERTSPSVGMLKRILDAVPISMSRFFSLELESEQRIFFRERELVQIADGAITYRQVGSNLGEHRLQILHERYRPGADTGRSLLSHEGEEGAILLTGRLEVTVGARTETMRAGDAFLFDSRIPHRFRNTGSEDVTLVSACTPPSF